MFKVNKVEIKKKIFYEVSLKKSSLDLALIMLASRQNLQN